MVYLNTVVVIRVTESQQQQEDRIKKLDKIIHDCVIDAKNTSENQDIVWHDKINYLAETIEEKYKLLGQDWAIENISQEITRMYREHDIKIWLHVRRYLPDKYKNKDFDTSISNAVSSFLSTIGQQEEQEHFSSHMRPSGRDLLEKLYEIKRNATTVSRDQVAELENTTAEIESTSKQITQIFKRRADLEHIALYPHSNNNTIPDRDRDPVTIDLPKPHGSLTFDAINRAIEAFQTVRDNVFKFPPEILEKDKEIAEGFDTIPLLLNAGLDLKYSKNLFDWFQAEKYRDIYGKHAAAVLSFSVTNLCANCSDENTKEWVRMEPVFSINHESYECLQCGYKIDAVCPICNLSMKKSDKPIVGWQCDTCGGTTPIQRDLTREQIGDKSSIVMDAAMIVLKHVPYFMSFCSWFRDWTDPRVGGRKTRLSSDLSEMA